jgi:hypothetical protein
VDYDNQPDTISQEFINQLHKDSFKVLAEVIDYSARKVAEVDVPATGNGNGNHAKLQAGGFPPGSTVRDLGNGMAMVEVPHQPVVPPRHCEPRVQSAYQQVLPREVKTDTSKFKWPA